MQRREQCSSKNLLRIPSRVTLRICAQAAYQSTLLIDCTTETASNSITYTGRAAHLVNAGVYELVSDPYNGQPQRIISVLAALLRQVKEQVGSSLPIAVAVVVLSEPAPPLTRDALSLSQSMLLLGRWPCALALALFALLSSLLCVALLAAAKHALLCKRAAVVVVAKSVFVSLAVVHSRRCKH
jgi:hypothetical protein